MPIASSLSFFFIKKSPLCLAFVISYLKRASFFIFCIEVNRWPKFIDLYLNNIYEQWEATRPDIYEGDDHVHLAKSRSGFLVDLKRQKGCRNVFQSYG